MIAFIVGCILSLANGRFTENERIENWHKHFTWPPNFNDESMGYRRLMEQREREIMAIPGSDERWENWMQFIMGRRVPSFTEHGYELTTIPPNLFEKVQKAFNEKIKNWETLPLEREIDAVYTAPGKPSKMMYLGNIMSELHQELKPLHEAWAGGIELVPTSIYGIRLYQNGSSLLMHVDKPETHVISSIVHVAHEYDNDDEPWTIDIEGLDGQVHSVALEPGQMLFYESAKCLHGRMSALKGKYYAGFFVHYKPRNESIWKWNVDDFINAIPPFWHDGVTESYGARWGGQTITTDSRVCEGAPPRVVGADNPRNEYNKKHGRPSGQRPPRLDRWYTHYPEYLDVDQGVPDL